MVYFARIIFANFAFQEKRKKIVGVSNKEGVVQGGSELTDEMACLPSYYMCVRFKMFSSLYKYFKKEAKGEEEPSKDGLPDPEGELSGKVPSSSILSANKEVMAVLNASKPRKCLRGSYDSFTPEEKAIIA